MKRSLYLFLFFVLLSGLAYADAIIITVTPEQTRAVQAQVLSPQGWLQKAWDMKAANCIEAIGKAKIGELNYRKLDKTERLRIIADTEFEAPSEERQSKPLIHRIIVK